MELNQQLQNFKNQSTERTEGMSRNRQLITIEAIKNFSPLTTLNFIYLIYNIYIYTFNTILNIFNIK